MVLVAYTLNIDTGILQTQRSHRERHEARRVGEEAMPLDAYIESGPGEREARLSIRPNAMHRPRDMPDHGPPGEHRFHPQAVLPRATLTPCEGGRIALGGMEAGITPDAPASVKWSQEPWQGVLRDVGGGTGPRPHAPPLVQPQTPCAPDPPAMMREALAAPLRGTPPFAHGVDQRDARGSDDAQPGRSGQEDLRPVLLGPGETQETGAGGEPGEAGALVACQPARKGPVAAPFGRREEGHGDHRSGPAMGLGGFGPGAQLLSDLREECGDKIQGGPGLLQAGQGCTLRTS